MLNKMAISLTYFNGTGRAEATRLALVLGDIEFEDIRINYDPNQWESQKKDFPLDQLPILKYNDTIFTQSAAQLRFAGRLANLYPIDPVRQLAVDEITEILLDILNKAPQSDDIKKKKRLREEYTEKHIKKSLAYVEQRIISHDCIWSAGSNISIADICVFLIMDLIAYNEFDFVPPDFCTQFVCCTQLYHRFSMLPKIRKYYLDRGRLEDDHLKQTPQTYTYDDDAALGQTCPSLDDLEIVTKSKNTALVGNNLVLLFLADYATGEYGTITGVSDLLQSFPTMQLYGISCDATRDQVESFVSKVGSPFPDIKLRELRAEMNIAYDANGVVRKQLQKFGSCGPSTVFVVNEDRKIIWREQLSRKQTVWQSQLPQQLSRVLHKKPLISNGCKPSTKPKLNEESDSEFEFDSDVQTDDSDGLLL
eukprot:m.26301 g.26301  ORF g.26301 m.26301 type:complete len:422 (-) comp7782_c0_seq1:161-1426(-)